MREHPVDGDGNCQFRALAHQLSGDASRHAAVRARVATQLRAAADRYSGFVSDDRDAGFDAFVARLATDGEWGDHVTLQAAADAYGVVIVLVTSYEHRGILRVEPAARSPGDRTIWVAFWAEIHYASIVDRAAA